MPVTLDEAGDHHLPLQIDDLGAFAAVFGHRGARAHVEYDVTRDRDRFRARQRFVHGDYVCIDEQQVGDGFGCLRYRAIAAGEQDGRKKHQDAQVSHRRDSTRLPVDA